MRQPCDSCVSTFDYPNSLRPSYDFPQITLGNPALFARSARHLCTVPVRGSCDATYDVSTGYGLAVFSSPEPLGSQGEQGLWYTHRAGVRPSVVHNFQRSSPLKPLCQSKPNFMQSLLGKGERKFVYGPGHMTKMAAMPIYGKSLKKSSSPEPAGRFPRNLVCSIGDSCPS